MKRACRSIIAAALPVLAAGLNLPAAAQDNSKWMRDCAQWVDKKGYSVDYIEQRTGVRPRGNMAQNWIANLEPKDAQPGDVVFLRVGDQSGQRAEVVDEVLRHADGSLRGFRTSSMNIGKTVEAACHITENFGKVVRRTVEFDRVIRAWRPGK